MRNHAFLHHDGESRQSFFLPDQEVLFPPFLFFIFFVPSFMMSIQRGFMIMIDTAETGPKHLILVRPRLPAAGARLQGKLSPFEKSTPGSRGDGAIAACPRYGANRESCNQSCFVSFITNGLASMS
ncbi:hypothetical protein LX36DRAFT_285417 [Colletotrichum falcatum]|nr:hypothetical protein LX36DRAFT_285417 [Colletotrichum falcatum]